MEFRDFYLYHWSILRRAGRRTWRLGRKHLYAEFAVSVAGAVTTWFLAGDAGLALVGGVLTGLTLLSVYFAWHLLLTPAEIHVEQENELAKYVPVQPAPKSYKGQVDFLYDVHKNISAGRVAAATARIGREAKRITEHMIAATEALEGGNVSIPKSRRVAVKLGREIQAGARRYRRVHKRYKAAAQGFAETFEGATPIFVARNPPEQVRSMLEEAIKAREKTRNLQVTTGQTRQRLLEALSNRQEQISIGLEQLNFVMKDLERTAGDVVATFDKIIKRLKK